MRSDTVAVTRIPETFMDGDQRVLDYLIANSGLFGRQILRLARWLHQHGRIGDGRAAAAVVAVWLVRVITLVFTYYVGGSLTGADQQTLARLRGMPLQRAWRLTFFNALCCGIPCAAGYFLLGEGFGLLAGLHSLTELPSLLARHVSLAVGAVSLAVDLFRAVDAAWHKRCWAPFGLFPFILNLPTYLKALGAEPAKIPPAARTTTPAGQGQGHG